MLKLVLTCMACPESWEAFDGEKLTGYLRLRHGHFTVQCPDVGGDLVYEAYPAGDGIFDKEERDYYLRFAVDRIEKWIKNGYQSAKEPAPDVQYETVGDPENWGHGDFDLDVWKWEGGSGEDKK